MCWLYSVPNLLVFQQLDILYLCENYVRAVCERVWRFQVWAFRVILTSDLWLATRKNTTHVKHAGSWRVTIARALQDKNGQSSLAINSRIKLTTHPSCKWVARMPCFTKNDFSHSSRTLLYISLYRQNVESFQREFWERKPKLTHPQS